MHKARDALLTEGRNPSIDAVRVEVGNTGSRSTIHRHHKDLEAQAANASRQKVAISEASAEVVERLATQLREEADCMITEAKLVTDARVEEMSGVLKREQEESQVQDLQVALRQANGGLAAKNQDLLQLNRGNVRLLAVNGGLEQQMVQAQIQIEQHQLRTDAHLVTQSGLKALQQRWSEVVHVIESMGAEPGGVRDELTRESESRLRADSDSAKAAARAETLETLRNRLELREKRPAEAAQLPMVGL